MKELDDFMALSGEYILMAYYQVSTGGSKRSIEKELRCLWSSGMDDE